MALTKCPKCRRTIRDTEEVCPYCKHRLRNPTPKPSYEPAYNPENDPLYHKVVGVIIEGIIGIIVGLGLIIFGVLANPKQFGGFQTIFIILGIVCIVAGIASFVYVAYLYDKIKK